MESHSSILVFIGYEPFSKGYRLWNQSSWTIVISTNITFNESKFPFNKSSPQPVQNPSEIIELLLPTNLLTSKQDSNLLDEQNPDLEGTVPNRDGAAPTITMPTPNLAIAISNAPGNAISLCRSTRLTQGQTRQQINNSWDDVNDDGTIQPCVSLTTEDNTDPPLLHAVLLSNEPASYHKAVKSTHKDEWDNAMQEEM
jgi:hypothetical protein